MRVRLLTHEDIDRYLTHLIETDAESGVDGAPHFHVYSRSEPFDLAAGREREHVRWATPIDQCGWRRAWALELPSGAMIGHLYLAGGSLKSELHRVSLGMGIKRAHHRQGGGTQLLGAAVAWARARSEIDWIDLGVFEENTAAQKLYRRAGFEERGRSPDRFRVDGHRIDDISMSLYVG